jgi:hypothetical protein
MKGKSESPLSTVNSVMALGDQEDFGRGEPEDSIPKPHDVQDGEQNCVGVCNFVRRYTSDVIGISRK